LVAGIHLAGIGSLYLQKQQRYAPCRMLKMNVNGLSTVIVVAYLVIMALGGFSRLYLNYCLP
jgi:hypothetical protein